MFNLSKRTRWVKDKYEAYPGWRYFPRTVSRLHGRWSTPNETETDYLSEDWDFLLILDACRFDVYEEMVNGELPGDVAYKYSPVSRTRDWVREVFGEREKLHDTVYVDANGNYAYIQDELDVELHAYIPTWDVGFYREDIGNSVSPDEMATEVVKAAERFPHKRIIAHFVQPHTPYLGPSGEGLDPSVPIQDLVHDHGVDPGRIRQAYRENLKLAIEEIRTVLPELDGKIVISADHGELLGERLFPIPVKDWGHLRGIDHPALRKVPWHTITNDTRRTVKSDPPVNVEEFTSEDVKKQLSALGYR